MTEPPGPVPAVARYAIMVDVGYIYAAAGELLMEARSRRDYRVDADRLIKALTQRAGERLRGELLRVYWYDAARDRVPTIDPYQEARKWLRDAFWERVHREFGFHTGRSRG